MGTVRVAWVVVVVSFAVMTLVAMRSAAADDFSSRDWISASTAGADIDVRWRMLKSLLHEHQLVGMSYREVCDLLGPDDEGNCETFEPANAAVRVMSRNARNLAAPPKGDRCTLRPTESGGYSTFGGLAPHFVFKVRDAWTLHALGDERTYLVLVFCVDGVVDKWILERED